MEEEAIGGFFWFVWIAEWIVFVDFQLQNNTICLPKFKTISVSIHCWTDFDVVCIVLHLFFFRVIFWPANEMEENYSSETQLKWN